MHICAIPPLWRAKMPWPTHFSHFTLLFETLGATLPCRRLHHKSYSRQTSVLPNLVASRHITLYVASTPSGKGQVQGVSTSRMQQMLSFTDNTVEKSCALPSIVNKSIACRKQRSNWRSIHISHSELRRSYS